MNRAVYRETLVRAAEMVGGTRALCARLGVRMVQLDSWLRGDRRLPVHIFLGAVDIVMDSAMDRFFTSQTATPLEEPTPR
jgi:hypothetical protein